MFQTCTDAGEWLQMIRAEYLEIPGMSLTKRQAQRLWGLDERLCNTLLDQLVASNFLRLTEANQYVRADDGQ